MEAEKQLRQWWVEQYPDCSLREPQMKEVFRRLWQSHGAFRHVSPISTEHLWYIDNCKIFEDYTPLSGEKAGHDRNSNTLFYEFWSTSLLIKTWLHGEMEWGEVLHRVDNVKVKWRRGKDWWIWVEKQDGEEIETMRTEGEAYWVDVIKKNPHEKVTEHCWNYQEEQGNSTLTETKDTTRYEESITNSAKISRKHWAKGPQDLFQGESETIEGEIRSINRWELGNIEGVETWETWESGKLVWNKEKRKRGEGWEVVERQNWVEPDWKSLLELLKTVVTEGNLDPEAAKLLQESTENSSTAPSISTQLLTLLHIELNTLRRNQITTGEVLRKLSSLATQLSPGRNGIETGEDIGEQLANTLERLVELETTVKARKEGARLGEEMEEFPSTLQQCFFLGLDLLSQAVVQQAAEPESPAAELLRSTKWIRQSPPLDSNTNRLMLVNFLKSALGLTMKLMRG
jgi:hypothetical protein